MINLGDIYMPKKNNGVYEYPIRITDIITKKITSASGKHDVDTVTINFEFIKTRTEAQSIGLQSFIGVPYNESSINPNNLSLLFRKANRAETILFGSK